MSKIGVRASSGGPERCVEVEVDLESCAARVGGREVNGSVAIGQVRVSQVRMNQWRVAVPNCQRPGLVMLVTCMTQRLYFDVNRDSALRPSSHGLLGQSDKPTTRHSRNTPATAIHFFLLVTSPQPAA